MEWFTSFEAFENKVGGPAAIFLGLVFLGF